MSSLLATHQAIRVARDLGYPKIEVPPPPPVSEYVTIVPPDAVYFRAQEPFKLEITVELVGAFLFCLGTLTLLVFVCFYG
jgi:hypothetical protein